MTLQAELSSQGRRPVMEDEEWLTTTAATMMQKEPPGFMGAPKELKSAVIIVRPSTGSKDIGVKYYWCVPRLWAFTQHGATSYLFFLEAAEDQLGFHEDTVVSTAPWPVLWQHSEPEPSMWRGIFSPTYNRKILFSQKVEFQTSELPRWKPHITIDRRTLEIEDG